MRRARLRAQHPPPSAIERDTLNISPLRTDPIREILRTQKERLDFFTDLAQEIQSGLERVIDEEKRRRLADAPPEVMRRDGGRDLSQVRDDFRKLQSFLFRVALDDDALSRTLAVARVNQLLEANEDLLLLLSVNPHTMGLSGPNDLHGIIVRYDFAVKLLGRNLHREGSLMSTESAQAMAEAKFATGVAVPEPYLAEGAILDEMFSQLSCMAPSARKSLDDSVGR